MAGFFIIITKIIRDETKKLQAIKNGCRMNSYQVITDCAQRSEFSNRRVDVTKIK